MVTPEALNHKSDPTPATPPLGRREFLKLFTATAVGLAMPKPPPTPNSPSSGRFFDALLGRSLETGEISDLLKYVPNEGDLRSRPGKLYLEIGPSAGFDVFIGDGSPTTKSVIAGIFNTPDYNPYSLGKRLSKANKVDDLFQISTYGILNKDKEKSFADLFSTGFAVLRIVFDESGNIYLQGAGEMPVAYRRRREFFGLFPLGSEFLDVDYEKALGLVPSQFIIKIPAKEIPTGDAFGGSADFFQTPETDRNLLDYLPAMVANLIAGIRKNPADKTSSLTFVVWPRDLREHFYGNIHSVNIGNKLAGCYAENKDKSESFWLITGHQASKTPNPSTYNFDQAGRGTLPAPVMIPAGAKVKLISLAFSSGGEPIAQVEVLGDSYAWGEMGNLAKDADKLGHNGIYQDRIYWLPWADIRAPII